MSDRETSGVDTLSDVMKLGTQSLRNIEYGLRLRVEGCRRRGQPTEAVEAKLQAVREELKRRVDRLQCT